MKTISVPTIRQYNRVKEYCIENGIIIYASHNSDKNIFLSDSDAEGIQKEHEFSNYHLTIRKWL